MNPTLRQGDVILIPLATPVDGTKLPHLTLAEGEVTGHRHRISDGEAELSERDGVLYLRGCLKSLIAPIVDLNPPKSPFLRGTLTLTPPS